MIDCHVHCRDEEQAEKETIGHALRVAEDSGLDAIFDMPNTARPVITRQRVLERFALAEAANSRVFYGIYVGVTANSEQIKEAIETWREFFPRPGVRVGVIGLKMFAGKSVGDLAIVEPEAQEFVYETLSGLNYDGVLAVHCEKESEMRPELWDSSKPWTHSEARPEKAEIESIRDQINFAINTVYKGHLHILHVSTPKSVDIVRSYRGDMRISCGVTPHHLLLNKTAMYGERGVLYKVNPPLRDQETMRGLFSALLDGRIDVLESDHAPHTYEEKTQQYMSGIPNLASWPDFIKILQRLGMHQGLIDRMTFNRVNEIFGVQIPALGDCVLIDHTGDYAFDPYIHLKSKKK